MAGWLRLIGNGLMNNLGYVNFDIFEKFQVYS